MRSAKILTTRSFPLTTFLFVMSTSVASAYFSSINFGMMIRDAFAVGILEPEVLSFLRDYESEWEKSDFDQKSALLGPVELSRSGEWAVCDDFRMISFNEHSEAYRGGSTGRDFVDAPLGWNSMMGILIWAPVSWETAYFSGRVTSFKASIGVADDRIVFENVIDPESGFFTDAAKRFLAEVPGRGYENILENGIAFSSIKLVGTTECPDGFRIFNVEGN